MQFEITQGDKLGSLKPPTITREGYEIEGWYKEPECINKINMIADLGKITDSDIVIKDPVLYAKWSVKKSSEPKEPVKPGDTQEKSETKEPVKPEKPQEKSETKEPVKPEDTQEKSETKEPVKPEEPQGKSETKKPGKPQEESEKNEKTKAGDIKNPNKPKDPNKPMDTKGNDGISINREDNVITRSIHKRRKRKDHINNFQPYIEELCKFIVIDKNLPVKVNAISFTEDNE